MSQGEGEARLKKSVGKLRRVVIGSRPSELRPEPINTEPTSAFELAVITRLQQLEADVAELRATHQWLIRLVIGGIVAAVLEMLTG